SQQQLAPARQKPRAVIELNLPHLRRRSRPFQRQEVIANLARASTEIVFGAQRGEIAADRRLLPLIVGDSGVGGPDAANRRIGNARMVLVSRPRRVPSRALSADIGRNSAVDGPPDMTLTVADHEVLMRYAYLRPKGERVSHGGHTLKSYEVHVSRCRQRRQPGPEPTHLPLGLRPQQCPQRP